MMIDLVQVTSISIIQMSCSIVMVWSFRCEYMTNVRHYHVTFGDEMFSIRYRKFNLNRDETLNRTLIPDVSTFTTDFEVTFGHFTGIDSLFESPVTELLKLEVRNFIYPVRLRSEMPFLTGE